MSMANKTISSNSAWKYQPKWRFLMNMVKKMALLCAATVVLAGCAGTGIPAGALSKQEGGTAVTAETKNTNWLGFTPMKDAQIQSLMRDVAKQCPEGEVVNGIYSNGDFNLGIVNFEKKIISGFCKQ